jgi:hypothetical protein
LSAAERARVQPVARALYEWDGAAVAA